MGGGGRALFSKEPIAVIPDIKIQKYLRVSNKLTKLAIISYVLGKTFDKLYEGCKLSKETANFAFNQAIRRQ